MDGAYRDDDRLAQLRQPPQSVEAEQAVLGGLLLVPEAWARVCDLLTEDDFYRRDHALIWRAVKALAEHGRPYDYLTVGEFLTAKGFAEQVQNGAYLVELASTTPSAANIVAYAEIVADKARMRRMIEVGTDLVNDCYQPDGRESSEIHAEAASKLAELQPAQRGGLRSVSESLPGWYERFGARFEVGSRMTGLPTPWHGFNAATHGLQPATVYLIAARPSMGKSVAALDLARFTALRGNTAALFSLEMSEDDCHNRNIAALADVPHDWILAPGAEGDEDYSPQVTAAMRELSAAPLFIDDMPGLTRRQFEARARRMHQRNPLKLLVVDHIHDFTIDPKLARFEYGAILQTGKTLAKEWNIPVVFLAQLNRQVGTRGDKRPTLTDLRESGELEQKGDVIVFMHREDYYDKPDEKTHLQGVVEMHFAKGRNVKAGARVYLRNRFDVMRLDDWQGPLPTPKEKQPQSVGFADDGDIFN